MNLISRCLVIAVCLLTSRVGFAMDIKQFEAMAEADQHAYLSDLIWGAAILLEQDCKPQVAAQLRSMFIHGPGAPLNTLEGTQALGDRLLRAGEQAVKTPAQASRIQVGEALRATLREKGIVLPDRFAAIDRAFKPKGPPLSKKPEEDGGFGSKTRDPDVGDALGQIAIKLLQNALDKRHLMEILEDTRVQGVCASPTAATPVAPASGVPTVANFDPSWIGRTMVVRGTVSRFVQKSVNGEPYVYLYFRERPDATVVACTRDDRWLLGVLGVNDFQSVVGTTLEFNLQVVKGTCTEEGAGLWIWQRNQARIVGSLSR